MGWEDPLEEVMATHSSILAWEIPWTEEPAGCSAEAEKEAKAEETRRKLVEKLNAWKDAFDKAKGKS